MKPLERLIHRYVRRRRDLIAEVPSLPDREAALALAAIAATRSNQPGPQSIVITADGESVSSLTRAIEHRLGGSSGVGVTPLIPGADPRREEAQLASSPSVVTSTPARLIDHIRRNGVDLSRVRTVAIDVPTSEGIDQFSADLHFIYAKFERRPVTVALVRDLGNEFDLLEDLLRRPTTVPDASWAAPDSSLPTSRPEESTMQDLPFKPEDLKARIQDIVRAIHHDEDPVELMKYRKYVRRHTTVFNRGYVLAYLLKQSLEGGGSRPSRKGKGETAAPSAGKQSIFVSIGRSKRVRSRDLVTFFTSTDGISEDDIGQVKVLDNYSFVEVNVDKAQAVVEKLNGQELRGRKLTVNFARKK